MISKREKTSTFVNFTPKTYQGLWGTSPFFLRRNAGEVDSYRDNFVDFRHLLYGFPRCAVTSFL